MQIRRQLLFVTVVIGLFSMGWLVRPPVHVQSALLITDTPSPVPTNTDTPDPTSTATTVTTVTNTPDSGTATNTPVTATSPPNTPSSPGGATSTPDGTQTPDSSATPDVIPPLGTGPRTPQLLLFGIGLVGAVLLLIIGWRQFIKKI